MRRTARGTLADAPREGLGDVIGRFFAQVRRLLEQKVALARTELRSGIRDLTRDAVLIASGGLLAAVGAIHLILALSLWVGDLLGSRPGGFALVGGVMALAGAITGLVGLRGFQTHSVVPRQTVTELRRDVAWIRNEL